MPHPVDVHVGKRVKQMRTLRGMSQADLGRELDLRFDQIQKYETGSNRIAASRMYAIAAALGVPKDYFFAGLDSPVKKPQGADADIRPPDGEKAIRQIRMDLGSVYPELQDRISYLVKLVLEERARFALLPIPNEVEALEEHRREDEFLRTIEAGLISIRQELPPLASTEISEAEAMQIKDQLVKVAKLTNQAVRYLDDDKGTYGGLYKIGIIAGVAGLFSIIPGVNFLSGAIIPTTVLCARSVADKLGDSQ